MEPFLKQLQTLPEVRELIQRIKSGGCPVAVNGLQPVHRACISSAVIHGCGRPAVFLCGNEREVRRLSADLHCLMGVEPVLLLSREWQFREKVAASRDWERNRLSALYALSQGQASCLVATADALCARTMPKEQLQKSVRTLEIGGRVDLHALTGFLIDSGYIRCEQVEGVGQFALRGGILDLFSPLMEQPVRCEFFDDEIDSMGYFDPATQRRIKNIKSARILPASEVLPAHAEGGLHGLAKQLLAMAKKKRDPALIAALQADAELLRSGGTVGGLDRYLSAIYPDFSCALDYLPDDSIFFLSESGRLDEQLKNTALLHRQEMEALLESGVLAGEWAHLILSPEELYSRLSKHPVVMEDALPTSRYPLPPKELLTINAKQLSSYGGSLETAAADMEHYRSAGNAVLVLCGSTARSRNLQRLLEDKHIPAVSDLNNTAMPVRGEVRIAIGALSAGSEWPQLKLAVLTEGQLQTIQRRKPVQKKASNQQKLMSYTDLSPGDLVVHVHHGVGRYIGIQRLPVDGVEKDYIKIEYADGGCLYVPATQLDLVSKYIGGGDSDEYRPARLNKLGGTEWTKQKTKAKAAVKDMAKELIALYAARARQPGYAFSPDSEWQREFESAFDYEETPDQLRCIAEIKADMERPRPMDRLLCGDVGYGKTEVAFRAIMKCILDGKQAAMLAPTTVLVQQHYATACSRFRSFPVRIELLSRFTSTKDNRRILEETAAGKIDLLIGTHKLLQKKMQFHDLGLLVVDEEQRFGVAHKERLRELSKQVDTLTLSATPIPRTLNMALTGLRDMSTLEEPPQDRQPVQTYVLEHDWGIISEAIQRELARGGQVYYLHNRVETIDQTAVQLRDILGPDVRITVGHGKKNQKELSTVMQAVVDGETDVLVCTTIIETGIDIPNVNTLIIEDADRMGLAQLHQIRGRIGRSSRRAYAYLTYHPGKVLPENAAKRLSAIREYVEFGSGFKIAMRDLEIRGAGNLLGAEQSGYMVSVGYDLYLRLLEEAVLEEKGETKKLPPDCPADLTVNANIPEWYVHAPEQRLDLYRRIAAIRNNEDAAELLDEMSDRYGEVPKSVLALLDVALLRITAVKAGVTDISQKGQTLRFRLGGEVQPQALARLAGMHRYRQKLKFTGGKVPEVLLTLPKGTDVLAAALKLAEDLHLEME